MGTVLWERLLPPEEAPVDEAHDIRRVSQEVAVSAMLVGRKEDNGPLVYLREVPLAYQMAWRVLDYRQQPDRRGEAEEVRHRWWRCEFKIPQDNEAGVRPGDLLMVAEHPPGNGWTSHATFSKPSREARHRPDPTRRAFRTASEMVQWLDGQPHDPWETAKHLVAGLSEPEEPFEEKTRNTSAGAGWLLGMTATSGADLERLGAELFESDELQDLLRYTERGTIKFWHPQAPTPPRLKPEVAEARVSLMWLAIRQALAGPDIPPDGPEADRKVKEWTGARVTKRADLLYRMHLNRLNRQKSSELTGEVDFTSEEA